MSEQLHFPWTIIEAKTVIEHAPTHLPALQILDRPFVGSTVRLCAVGDIGLSGRVATSSEHGEVNPLSELAPVLRTGDITFGNLESPLAGAVAPGQMFAAPLSGAALLSDAGFNLIHLANNHISDYGKAGLAATLHAVSEAGMMPLGAGHSLKAAKQLVATSRNGLKIGWLGCGRTLVDQGQVEGNPYYWEFDEKELLDTVERTRSNVDILIVSIHIGLMYINYPRPEHKIIAEKLMDAGVNLILMHHAHVLQGLQLTSQGSVCCYNLGNFLFDWQEGNVQTPVVLREQNEGAIFLFTLDRRGVAQATALPTWIDDSCRVHWATGKRGQEILMRLRRISRDLKGDYLSVFRRQRAERNVGPVLKVLLFHIRHGNWAFVLDNFRKIRLEHLEMSIRWCGRALRQFSKGVIS